MTIPFAGGPGAEDPAADRLRDIESVTDAALSRLDEQALLDALVERVKMVLQADTAAVLLLDRAAQLVATAASGIEEEVRQGVRIPLGTGFAGRVAATREPVILTRVDRTTVRNPLLVDRGIKSLLGVPLLAGGRVIGVLHVGSLGGRTFGQQDVELLQLAAHRAALALHSLMAQDDGLAAVALQHSLLPTALPAVPGLSLAARYVTGSGAVGGDWYDVFVVPDGRLAIVVGDVAGSGLEAAVIMGRMRSALRAYVLETPDTATALRMLDRKIQYFEPNAMATVFYGLYTPGTGEFAVSSAGHLPPVLATSGGQAGLLPIQPDPPIGTADDPERRVTTVFIPPGALLCCYTDGLVERRSQPLDQGMDRLAAVLAEVLAAGPGDAAKSPAEDAAAGIMRALVGNTAAEDDIAVLVLSRPESVRNGEAPAVVAGLAFFILAGTHRACIDRKAGRTMPAKSSQSESGGFSAAERAAMQARAAELRAEGKAGAKKADGLQALLESIEKMTPENRALAERVHATISAAAPELSAKTWYGMPAYVNDQGKVVVAFKNSGKFGMRYSTLEFQDAAHLDDGDVWAVSFALPKWTPAVEQKITELMKAAVS